MVSEVQWTFESMTNNNNNWLRDEQHSIWPQTFTIWNTFFPVSTWTVHIGIKFTIYVNRRAAATTNKNSKYLVDSYTFLERELQFYSLCNFNCKIYLKKESQIRIEYLALLFWPLLNAFKCTHSISSNDFWDELRCKNWNEHMQQQYDKCGKSMLKTYEHFDCYRSASKNIFSFILYGLVNSGACTHTLSCWSVCVFFVYVNLKTMSFSRLYEDIIKINIKADYKSTNCDHLYQAPFFRTYTHSIWFLFCNFLALNREKTLKRTKSWQTKKRSERTKYGILFSLATYK